VDNMEIEILKKEKDYMEIEFKNEDQSFVAALKEILLEDKNVEFAASKKDHPLISNNVLIIRTSEGSPMVALKSAIKKLKKEISDFKTSLKEAKKTK